MGASNVLVGGKVIIRFGDKIIGFANSAACTDDYGMEMIQVLGQLQAIDYVPTRARHQIVLDTMVLRTDSLAKANMEPTGAGNFGFLSSGATWSGSIIGSLSDSARDFPDYTATGAVGALRVLHGQSFDIEILAPAIEANSGAQPTPSSTVYQVVKYKKCYYDNGNVTFAANRVTVKTGTFYALDRVGYLTAGATITNISG